MEVTWKLHGIFWELEKLGVTLLEGLRHPVSDSRYPVEGWGTPTTGVEYQTPGFLEKLGVLLLA
jgi:hypothetical protein